MRLDGRPILIVGGGPVGMVLAMNLDALGVKSLLIEREPRARMHPKGGTQNARTLEHYRRLGVAGAIRRLGMPDDQPTDVVYTTTFAGWELSRIRMPSERDKQAEVARSAATAQVPEPIFRCNQMYVEDFLFRHVGGLAHVERCFGWECVAWSDEGDGVRVTIREVGTGVVREIEGSYLVGADGGQSGIRRALGIRYAGTSGEIRPYLGGPMVSTHLRVPDFYKAIPLGHAYQYWAISARLRSNTVVLNGRDEFLYSTKLAGADDTPDDNAIVSSFIASTGVHGLRVELIGHWTWMAGHALVADRFRHGRVLLAGDAVHLFTPAGAFGMNTGIDDVANLGWKLAAVVQGWGGPGLLDTYESERRPIAFRNTGAARALARNIGDVPVGPAMEETSLAGDADRATAAACLAGFAPEFSSLGVQLGARYDGSAIVVPDAAAPPAEDFVEYRPSGVPGGRAPHFWMDAGRGAGSSMFDRFGPGFTLLRLGGHAPDAAGFVAAARARGVPLRVLDVPQDEARDLYGADLALIRPDQHLAWRGDAAPGDAAAVLARVTGYENR